ncbi:MAG: 5'/3'-nucleotidase SurE [Candidatus Riflebacteria bacterium]|nr:5'/3'-nucleotidase SurE [Candidatus Riflebacteria bacterium]
MTSHLRPFAFVLALCLALTAGAGFAGTPLKTLHILVSNDDGVDSEGIAALVNELRTFARVTVAAPVENFSGAGHSLTVKGPIMVNEVKKEGKFFGYGIEATPATCVKIGLDELIDEPVDLVVSGINEGYNIGELVYNSGTFGAAQEGILKGIPAIATSLERSKGEKMDYEGAAAFVKAYILAQAKVGFPTDRVVNINFPAGEKSSWKGIALTSLSDFEFNETWFRRKTPWGKTYFWNTVKRHVGYSPKPGTDLYALDENKISITPVPMIRPELDARCLGRLHVEFEGMTLERR